MLMFYLLILGNVLMIGSFLVTFKHLPPQIPLFYSQVWGENQLGEIWMIFFLLIAMNGFYFLNYLTKRRFFPDNKFVDKICYYLNGFIIIGFTFIFLKIIFSIN
jgi:hypothetical protein